MILSITTHTSIVLTMNDIKEVMPYVALADNLEYSNQVLAYYLRKYASGRVAPHSLRLTKSTRI